MKPIALITGATAGIGLETAKKFAQNNYNLILTGRRKDRLEELARELQQSFDTTSYPLDFDISDKQAVNQAMESLPEPWKKIDVLVNNAGLAAGLNPIQEGKTEDWDRMIDTNIKGLLYISRIVIPWMLDHGRGHIINIGSVAGRDVYPRGNVYCATKFAVDAITKSMRIDLLGTGLRITQIAPGAVETEFSMVRFNGDAERAKRVYEGYEPLRAEDVADSIYYVTTLPPHVNINDLLIMPIAQVNPSTFHKT